MGIFRIRKKTPFTELNTALSEKFFDRKKLMKHNVKSQKCHTDDFTVFLDTLKEQPDILALTGFFLSEDDKLAEFELKIYQ